MLETMMHAPPRKPRGQGFTLIELMVVIAVIAIVLTLAAPSFTGFMAKKRVEGVLGELSTDLQYARSEAVAKNKTVRVTFGTACYLITHYPDSSSPASTCTQSTYTLGSTDVGLLKLVQLQSGTSASFSPLGTLTYIEFDPVRGIAQFSTGSTSGSVDVVSSIGSYQLRAMVTAVGSMSVCSPSGSVSGYTSC